MTPLPSDLIGPLYLGAKDGVVPPFLRPSFDGERPRRSGGGTVLLSSKIVDVYADGAYEEFGCVLEVWLHKGTRWRYPPAVSAFGSGKGGAPTVDLDPESRRGLDAIRLGAGERWCVWNPAVVSIVRRLRYSEAIPLLCSDLDDAGPTTVFEEGLVFDYASIWWDRAEENSQLSVLQYRQRLERVLRRYVGRKRTQARLIKAQNEPH